MLESGKILGGLAILEDANHNTGQLTAVPVEEMERKEEELLELVKSWKGRIPLPLDILILDEIGKNFSGAGMDTKVVNRGVYGDYNPWADEPRIERVFVRDLSPHSYGNAVGLGDGGCNPQPAARKSGLERHLDQFADRIHALRDPDADSFSDRPGMPGAHRPYRRPAGPHGGNLRLDQEFAGAGHSEIKREFAG